MGMLISALNHFTFSRKYYVAWNTLMAAYTYEHLFSDQKQQLMDKTEEIESSAVGRSIEFNWIIVNRSKTQLNYLYSLAFMSLGIQPALGRDPWYEVKNAHDVLHISEKVLAATRCKLEKQFNVEFPKF